MSERTYFVYPVPEIEGMLFEVVEALTGDEDTQFGWETQNAYVVAVEELTAAIYLRAVFTERPTDKVGVCILEDHEIWVERHRRPECETLLAENCPSTVQWFDLLEVSFATEDQHRQFAAAYTAITGLGNAFSAVPTSSQRP
jgi:hypothetical protein